MANTSTSDTLSVTYKYSKDILAPVSIPFTSALGDAAHPKRAHPSDAGADLTCLDDVYLAAGERAMVDTGISVAIPEGFVGMICPRSGLAAKHGISVTNSPGIIDSSYRGPIKVILHNLGGEPWTAFAGDRVAQLVILKVELSDFVYSSSLDQTDRGDGGFGSTGTK